jgi:putative inorganic carbon (hco3(-)) transporter
MPFAITLVYLILSFLSPAEMMPALAPLRPMLILSAVGLLSALLTIPMNQTAWRSSQVLLLAAFIFSLLLSRASTGWLGGVPLAFMAIMHAAACFYLTIGSVNSINKLKFLTLCLLLVALYLGTMGALAFHDIIHDERFLHEQIVNLNGEDEPGETLVRTRALGFMNDPNDFAQFLVLLLPLLWLWWKQRGYLWNALTIGLPSAGLVYGIYLTRSRGAAVGMSLMALLALRRRMGTIGSTVLAAGMGFGFLALGFTGGRGISIGSGTDRLALWSQGLGLLKRSPAWGIGYQDYANFTEFTAHNAFIQCMAENGMLGYSLWLGLLITNMYYLHALMKKDAQSTVSQDTRAAAQCISLAFYGLIVTSWFLSRAYVPTLYLMLGLTVALQAIAANENPKFIPFQLPAWMPARVLGTAVGSLALFYVVVNLR